MTVTVYLQYNVEGKSLLYFLSYAQKVGYPLQKVGKVNRMT